jgi:hypothetical protein
LFARQLVAAFQIYLFVKQWFEDQTVGVIQQALESHSNRKLSSVGAFLNSTPLAAHHFPPENFGSHAADAKRRLLHRKVSNAREKFSTLFFCAHRFAPRRGCRRLLAEK